MTDTLLPPNTSELERAAEVAMRADIDLSMVGTLWNPASCPADILPFLAWGLSISHWDAAWSEAEKRAAIAAAIAFHKIKGTRAAVEQVLARFHPLLDIVEWWEANPRGAPGTFEIRAPAEIPASFLTSETATAIIRDVAAAKRASAHFDFVQHLEAEANIWLSQQGNAGSYARLDMAAEYDESRNWMDVLQTEYGEPVSAPNGLDYLETA